MKNKRKSTNLNVRKAEELRFENELLKLKIQAEFGTSPVSARDIPPEIENSFLKNILKIERAFINKETVSLFDKIGQPKIVDASELNETEIKDAQTDLEALLADKRIFVTFPEHTTFRDKYIFITERLFNVQVDNLEMPETMMYFNCVDFEDEE